MHVYIFVWRYSRLHFQKWKHGLCLDRCCNYSTFAQNPLPKLDIIFHIKSQIFFSFPFRFSLIPHHYFPHHLAINFLVAFLPFFIVVILVLVKGKKIVCCYSCIMRIVGAHLQYTTSTATIYCVYHIDLLLRWVDFRPWSSVAAAAPAAGAPTTPPRGGRSATIVTQPTKFRVSNREISPFFFFSLKLHLHHALASPR